MATVHRIDQLLFDLAFESPAMARAESLRSLVVDKLLPLLEQVFDQFGSGDDIWQIDQLDVDIGDVTEAELPAALVAGLQKALTAALHDGAADADSLIPQGSGSASNGVQGRQVQRYRDDADILLRFLAEGTMPWQMNAAAATSHQALLARVLEQNGESFLTALAVSPQRATMLMRLARQFAPVQLQPLLYRMDSTHADAMLAQLTRLQTLLRNAALPRTVVNGALGVAWEEVLAAALERKAGVSWQASLAPILSGRVLAWLAQQGQDSRMVASHLRHLSEAALQQPSGATPDGAVTAMESAIEATDAAPREMAVDYIAARPAMAENMAAGELADGWRLLQQGRHDRALLTRLVQQTSAPEMQALLQRFNPVHAGLLQARLQVLLQVLRRTSFSTQQVQAALAAAWELAFDVLPVQAQTPDLASMLDEVVAALAAAMPANQIQTHAQLLAQLRQASVALAGAAEMAAVLSDMQQALPPAMAIVATERESIARSSAENLAAATPGMPVRNRLSSALLGGHAGNIYEDWHGWYHEQPDLLRSAFLHYAAYAETREQIAAAFPLSLLLDTLALLVPEAASLTAVVWHDEQLRNRVAAAADATQWSQWRRNWWRGASVFLLHLARTNEVAPQNLAAVFDAEAFVAAALEASAGNSVDDALSTRVAALTQGHAPQLIPQLIAPLQRAAEPEPPVQTWQTASLAALLEAIRDGRQPLQKAAFSIGQLEQLLHEAVPEPSFYRAIVLHAATAHDRHTYYVRVLHALAHHRIVDLEACASAGQGAELPDAAAQDNGNPATAGAVEMPVQEYMAPDTAVPVFNAGNAETLSDQHKQNLVGRLARALMKGDAAALYGDWDMLLHKHASLLGEALRHYGIRADILERITQAFPESMLFDMALLLAPGALPAWQQLRDQEPWPSMAADDITPPSADGFRTWKRQLWQTALQHVLHETLHNPPLASSASAAADEPDGLVDVVKGSTVGAVANAVDGSGLVSPADLSTFSVQHLLAALADHPELGQLAWQERFLSHWAALSLAAERAALAPDLPVPSVIAATDSAAAPMLLADPAIAPDERAQLTLDVQAILLHRHVTATSLPPAVRVDLLPRYARLKEHSAALGMACPVADLEQLVALWIAVHAPDAAPPQQSADFLQAIVRQAPPAPARRAGYFSAVLQSLQQGQTLDLEEIADASAGIDTAGQPQLPQRDFSATVVVASDASDSADGKAPADAAAATNDDDQAYLDFLQSPAFGSGTVSMPGLAAWLQQTITLRTPHILPLLLPVLAQLARQPQAVVRLLALLPEPVWPQLAALALYPAPQVQRLRRYAGDVTELFAELQRQHSAADLVRFEWQFLLPYLFVPERLFEPLRFTAELIGFLARQSGSAVPPGLAARLQQQMGIVLGQSHAAAAQRAGVGNVPVKPSGSQGTSQIEGRIGNQAAHPMPSGIHVANAGLVLAWPFLSRAWEVLELTHEGKFVDQDAAERAAWLLQFAVDEQTALPEYQLPLNKLLCGIPLQSPIVAEIEVTPKERELIEQMLTVLITHWKTIGNTSIRGLRETFLQRDGVLSQRQDGWHLQVTRRTFDMLLEKLPWSIATIRLPWMESILWVEWT